MEILDVSVVIPAHNAAETIGDQLEALTRQHVRGRWEVVVVDDESTDGTCDVVSGYRDRLPIVMVSAPPGVPSPARARNLGVEAARGEIVLFCDADDVVEDTWLEAMQQALTEHAFVAARWDEARLNDQETLAGRGPLWRGLLTWYGAFLPYAGSGTLGVRRRVHQAVGGFDESFVTGGEELDYSWRIQLATREPLQYVPDAVVHYRYRSSLRAIFRQARDYGASDVHAYAKWRPFLPVPENQWRAGWWAAVRAVVGVLEVRDRATLSSWLWQVGNLLGHVQASRRLGVLLLCANPNLARDPIATRAARLRQKLTPRHSVEHDDERERTVPMSMKPAATVAVVPRETLSQVKACLETLVANTQPPYRLVIVDACYPKATRRWLDSFARRHDATLLRADRPLTPNEARNAALEHIDTEYVVFLDDNAFVRPGWLDALVRCADETGAAIVGPLYGFRSRRVGRETVHMFGGENHVVEEDGERYHIDRDFHDRMPLDEAEANLHRTSTEVAEFHCMLVRTDLFTELGPLDEQLRSTSDHMDLCMLARERGREVWLEPESVVVYELLLPIPLRDRAFYVLRWCDAWNRASEDHFAAKWRLSPHDPSLDAMMRWATDYRRVAYRLSPKWLDRAVRKVAPSLVPRVDQVVQRVAVRRYERKRASSRGVQLVRAGSWYGHAGSSKPASHWSRATADLPEPNVRAG